MKNRREGAYLLGSQPWLLVALVAVLTLVDGGVWAQAAGNYSWPYFGPDLSTRAFVNGAFMAQAGLLGAFSAAPGGAQVVGMQTLQLIGALCALVGGIFLAFNRKLWTPSVIASWLIVVVVVIFVPVNSRLLFAKLENTNIAGNSLLRASNVGSPMMTRTNYGFAPQMAAVDVASRAQVIVSDMFRSNGWRNITEEMLAAQRLRADAKLNAGGTWLGLVSAYNRSCQEPLDQLYSSGTSQQAGSPNTQSQPALRGFDTIQVVWSGILNDYQINSDIASMAPPLMILYDERHQGDLGSSFNRDAYASAIGELLKELSPGSPQVSWAGNLGGSISVKDALDRLTQLGFFNVTNYEDNNDALFILPGFYLQPKDRFDRFRASANQFDQESPFSARICYMNAITRLNTDSPRRQIDTRCTSSGDVMISPDAHRTAFLAISGKLASNRNDFLQGASAANRSFFVNGFNVPFSRMSARWQAFIKAYRTLSGAQVGSFLMEGLARGGGGTGGSANQLSVQGQEMMQNDCRARGQHLVNTALNVLNGTGNSAFNPLTTLLTTPGATIPERFTMQQVAAGAAEPGADRLGSLTLEWQRTAEALQRVLNAQLDNVREMDNQNLRSGLQPLTPDQKRMLLLAEVMRLIHGVTLNTFIKNAQTPEERGTVADATEIRVVGSNLLTSTGGYLAQFFGQILIAVGAFFTGAVAQAFVGFLQLVVQLTIMALIVLTPFLLLAGVLMPSAAAGVIFVSVIAAFVLQFVPVTMIILNYLGGLIYEIIGATNLAGSTTIRNMLIIAMSGLYTTVVGLTLYLMFKLGDPSALIGRLGSLDDAAKKAADAGMKATLAAAAGALTILGATVGGTGGALMKFAAGGRGGRLANAAAGAIDGAKSDKPKKEGDSSEANTQHQAAVSPLPGSDSTAPKNTIDELNQDNYNRNTAGQKIMEAGSNAVLSQDYNQSFKMLNEDTGKEDTFTAKFDPSGKLVALERGNPGDADYKRYMPPEDKDAGNQNSETSKAGQDTTASGGVETGESGTPAVEGKMPAKPNMTGDSPSSIVPGTNVSLNALPFGRNRGPVMAPPDMSGQGSVNTSKVVNAPADDKGAGNLAAAAATTVTPEALAIAEQQRAAATNTNTPPQPKAPKARTVEMPFDPRKSLSPEANAALDKILTTEEVNSFAKQMVAQSEEFARHHNTRVGDEIDKLKIDKESLSAQKQKYLDENKIDLALLDPKKEGDKKHLDHIQEEYVSKIDAIDEKLKEKYLLDTSAMEMGYQQMALERLSHNLGIDNAKGAADKTLGFWGSVKSGAFGGFIGGLKAIGGGAGSIPFIGGVMREAVNEWYEAPERARAYRAAGGFWKHWNSSTDAQRKKAYEQEIAPLAAGYQYQQMTENNTFQYMADASKFQVAQSVAKMRSEYDAMLANAAQRGKVTLGDIQANNINLDTKAVDLAGLGRVSAMSSIGSVWGEAASQQTASWKVQVLGADGKLQDEFVKPTAMALSKIYSELGVKSAGKYFDEAMVNWYGIVEKTAERPKPEWEATRGMAYDKEAAGRFMAEDISTDYLAGGHLKMVQGKQQYAGYVGQYQAFLELRNKENAQLFGHIHKNSQEIVKGLKEAEEKKKKDGLKFSQEIMDLQPAQVADPKQLKALSTSVFAALTKVATKSIGKERLPLAAIFEEATTSGYYSVLEKSAVAPYNIAARRDELVGKVLKAQSALIESSDVSKTVQRQVGFEFNRVKYNLDKATFRIAERAFSAFGEQTGGLVMEAITQVIKDKGGAFAKEALKTVGNEGITKGGVNGKTAYHTISDEMLKAVGEELLKAGHKVDVRKLLIEGNKFGLIEAFDDTTMNREL
jgi:hypothetical protein